MEKIKKILRPIYVPIIGYKGSSIYKQYDLLRNFIEDYLLFKKHSIVLRKNDIKNKEADLILHYHSIEKGMLYYKMKSGFAKHRIKKLHLMLADKDVLKNVNRDQIKTAYRIMCKYYELHREFGYKIEDIFPKDKYNFYVKILENNYKDDFSGILNWTRENFLEKTDSDFFEFANSRKSVRDFTGENFSLELITKVIDLANTAPSVCNRQASNVYLLENKIKIDKALKIQGGFKGYSDNVNQLLILTNDRKYYYTVGERNQFYIDGGAYLMNLLYALHYYKIGNCPANWGKTVKEDKQIRKLINIPISEKIICMIPIGVLKENFRTTLSKRRSSEENLILLN